MLGEFPVVVQRVEQPVEMKQQQQPVAEAQLKLLTEHSQELKGLLVVWLVLP